VTSIVVVAPTTSSNALGRALSVADLARAAGLETRLYGPADGPLWVGAAQHEVEVRTFSDPGAVAIEAAQLEPPLLVWVVKPLRRSWRVGELLQRRRRAAIVLDLDDHDEALSREFRARSLGNRLRLHPLRMLHPARVRATRDAAVAAADGFTYSSDALARELALPASRPRLRVPHPRPSGQGPARAAPQGGPVHAGCLGTLREHKGLSVLSRLLAREESLVLHVFDPPPGELRRHRDRVVAHPAGTPLADLYSQLHVSLLPQGVSEGARLQVPAKLLDSMRFGVPAMATPTTAIDEIAGDAYWPVRDWRDPAHVAELIGRCAADPAGLGARGRARFERELSLEAQVGRFAGFVAEATWRAGSRPDAPAG
jgi:glycosyltransferase involved in cell wall biosynthesis